MRWARGYQHSSSNSCQSLLLSNEKAFMTGKKISSEYFQSMSWWMDEKSYYNMLQGWIYEAASWKPHEKYKFEIFLTFTS